MRKVYPVEGRYLNGVPHVAHDCDDELCVESGAFTTKKPTVVIGENGPEIFVPTTSGEIVAIKPEE